MAKTLIKNEVVRGLLTKIAPMVANNKLRIMFGMKVSETELSNKLVIVDKGMQVETGFKSSTPKGGVEIPEGSPCWKQIIVSAADFQSFLGAMVKYESDITFDIKDSTVDVLITGVAKVSLNLYEEDAAESLISANASTYIVKAVIEKASLAAVERGGFLAGVEPCQRMFTDRVVLSIKDGDGGLCSFSTNNFSFALASADVKAEINKGGMALSVIHSHLSQLEKSNPAEALKLQEEIKSFGKDLSKYIEKATALGMKEGAPYRVAIPTLAWKRLMKLYGDVEKVQMVITGNHLVCISSTVMCVVALATVGASAFIDKLVGWLNTEWSARAVVDRDRMLQALTILKLSNTHKYLTLKCDKTLVMERDGNTVKVPLTSEAAGDCSVMERALLVSLFDQIVGRFGNGNLTISACDIKATGFSPICLSSGATDELRPSLNVFILPFDISNESKEEEEEEEEEKKKEKKEKK